MPVAPISAEEAVHAAFLAYAAYQDNTSLDDVLLPSRGWSGITGDALAAYGVDPRYFGGTGDSVLFQNGNAAAFLATRGNTIAISFRGTGGEDWVDFLSDMQNNVSGGFYNFQTHYDLFQPLISAFVNLINSQNSSGFPFERIIVAGHSLGAAMVERLMGSVAIGYGDARPFVGLALASPGVHDIPGFLGGRLVSIEHTDDPVVDVANIISGGEIGYELTVNRPEASSLNISEHSIATYLDTVGLVFGTYSSGQFNPGVFSAELSLDTRAFQVRIGDGSNNTIFGTTGQDAIFGRDGQDNIFGGSSRDLIDGGEGSDDIRGEGGNDELRGGGSFDFLYGGTENDRLFGGDSFDHLYGEAHNDELHGDGGNDNLFGGSGNDTLYGGADRDTLRGEDGNDTLDGGAGNEDVAVYALSSAGNYWITDLSGGNYRVTALTGQEGTDTLTGIERLRFYDGERSITEWLTIQNGTAPPPAEPPATVTPPSTPGPTTSSLLSVTPVNQTLRVGESVGLSAIFPQSGWVDNDGPRDIQWVYVQDRSAGGGYLTNNGVAMNAGTVHTIAVADLANWNFVAGRGAGTDELGFNIVQTNLTYSPRLTTGAIITTVPANTVTPPVDDHADNYGSATVMSAGVVTGFVSASGTIGTAFDQDWFSVELQAGQTYAFALWPNSTTNSLLDPRLTVQAPNGSTYTNDNLTATTLMSFVNFTATQSGVYHLLAQGVNGTTGGFIVTALPITVDPTAGGLTEESGNTDPGNSYWQWEGTSGDDRPSELTLESGGRPQTSGNNYYRGHGGEDRIYADGGNDVVWGDSGNDTLYGEDGHDTLRGGTSSDSVYGGDGNDLLYGEDGDDNVGGGVGNDTLYGGDDEDRLRGNDGDDYIKGEDDNDDIDGGNGDDQLYGDRGDDTVEGGNGNDFMMGGRGNDLMDGDAGQDRLAGEAGNDSLDGDDGDDVIYGGDDNDTLMGGEGNDILHGEDGIDTADFSDGDEGVRVNLFDEIAISTDLGTDRLYEIENVRGSEGDDIIDGDHGVNVLDGHLGNDNIRGHNGNDTLIGGTGNDTLWGDAGNDSVIGDADDDELRGGLGEDTLLGGGGNDRLLGEQGNDTIDGGDGNDTVFFWGEREDFSIVASGAGFVVTDLRVDGLEGQDFVTNVEFFEFFDGTVATNAVLQDRPATTADNASTTAQTPIVLDVLGNDSAGSLALELLSVQVQGGGGTAYVAGNRLVFDPRGAFDNLASGTSATISLTYVVRSEGLLTSTGTVEIVVASDRDILTGDQSNNELNGYLGNDLLNGREGNDTLDGGAGNDSLSGGMGNDLLDGGDGSDRVYYTGITAATVNLSQTTAQITGHGTDTILNVEHISSGSGNDRLTGNALGNSMSAGEGNDTLDGGAGNDWLYGGAGNDSLTGGLGNDVFVFNTMLGAGNVDRINDLSVMDDTIRLDDAAFVGLSLGALSASAFTANLNGQASDALDRIIYETDTGRLYFDADGSGASARVHFATLSTNLSLGSTDFFIF